jgi:hypothetical protein
MPKDETKILDILTSIGLEPQEYLVDMFKEVELGFDSLMERTDRILKNPAAASKYVRSKLDSEYETIFNPVRELGARLERC